MLALEPLRGKRREMSEQISIRGLHGRPKSCVDAKETETFTSALRLFTGEAADVFVSNDANRSQISSNSSCLTVFIKQRATLKACPRPSGDVGQETMTTAGFEPAACETATVTVSLWQKRESTRDK